MSWTVSKLSTTFYDFSVSRNLFSKAEMRQFGKAGTEGLRNPKLSSSVKDKKWGFRI